jgi:hypothetical protein
MTGLDSAELAQLETICQKLARQNEQDGTGREGLNQ